MSVKIVVHAYIYMPKIEFGYKCAYLQCLRYDFVCNDTIGLQACIFLKVTFAVLPDMECFVCNDTIGL